MKDLIDQIDELKHQTMQANFADLVARDFVIELAAIVGKMAHEMEKLTAVEESPKSDVSLRELWSMGEIQGQVYRVLRARGIHSVSDVRNYSADEIQEMRGCGQATMLRICELAKRYGVRLRSDA